MQYLCLIHIDPDVLDAMPAPELDALNEAHLDLNDALRASGQLVAAEALQRRERARTVRLRNGRATITDGPFAETKELIAGFYLLEAESFDEACEIAARIPSAPIASIEVREIMKLVVGDRTS